MCMIAHRFLGKRGSGQNIPNGVIDTALYRHPDGYGVAWRDPEEGLLYEKFAPQDRQKFRALLKDIDSDPTIEYVAHFRYATHGPEDEAHAHPYMYMDPDPKVGAVLVFHNGVFSSMTTKPTESDTEVFVRDFLAHLPSRWWTNKGIRKLVDEVGGWSRLVLMTETETVNLNHYAGEEDGGLWYSSDHKPSAWATSGKGWSDEDYDNWKAGYYGSEHISDEDYKAPKAKSAEIGETTNPRANDNVWMHAGHELAPMQTFDFTKDGDYECSVICETCGTAGDVYIIDGKAYIDIPHAWDTKADAEPGLVTASEVDPDVLLPGEPLARQAAIALLTDGKDNGGCIVTPTPVESVKPKLEVLTGASGQTYARVN